MTAGEEPLTRDERRRRSEATILQAARALFAESGFERTTIRAVAARAGLDPALVMQHYGSKEGLFAAAARGGDDAPQVLTATREDLPAAALHVDENSWPAARAAFSDGSHGIGHVDTT